MKFAYLIMAHDNQNQLINLLKMLDDDNNDIFLHVDIKSHELNPDILKNSVYRSRLIIYKKFDVKWAGLSQTQCQVYLLTEAIKTYHDYYHLISGHDLPIKNNDIIQDFFQRNAGKQFVHFESNEYCMKDNCRYYHLGSSFLSKAFLYLQKRLGINRKLYCGANWYSITHDLAIDFCNKKEKMLKMVRWTISSDEYILQTFIKKVSTYEYELYKPVVNPYDYEGAARLIDWYRGNPYVWKESDYKTIVESDRMFARKFDEKIDDIIIQKIGQYINAQGKQDK